MSGCRLASWRLDLSRARTSHAVSAWLSSQHSRSWPNRRETIWKVSRTRRAHIVPVSNAGALPVLGRQPLFELNSDSRPTLTKSDSEQSDVDGWGFHKSFDGSFGSTPSSVHRAATESREIVFQARSVFSFARERERERDATHSAAYTKERDSSLEVRWLVSRGFCARVLSATGLDKRVVQTPETPEYVLEDSLASQALWHKTAGTRPAQPTHERKKFEEMWAQNFTASQVDYNEQCGWRERAVHSRVIPFYWCVLLSRDASLQDGSFPPRRRPRPRRRRSSCCERSHPSVRR